MKGARFAALLLGLSLLPGVATAQDPAKRLEADLAAYWSKILSRDDVLASMARYPEAALPHLRKALERRVTITLREPILRVIVKRISPKGGERFLIDLLGTQEPRLRRAVLRVLAQVGTPAAADPLMALFSHPRGAVRSEAARTLGAIGRRHELLAEGLALKLKTQLAQALAGKIPPLRAEPALLTLANLHGSRALPEILACVQKKTPLRRPALSLLANLSPPRADPDEPEPDPDLLTPQRALLGLLKTFRELKPNERALLLQALRVWGDYDSVEPLLEYMAEAGPKPQALATLTSLTGQTFSTLAAWKRYWQSLAPIWEEYEDLLLELGDEETPPAKLTLILGKLERIRGARTVAAIGSLLQHLLETELLGPAVDLAQAACESLARLKDATAAPYLVAVINSTTPYRVRYAAAWALSVLTGRGGARRGAESADPTFWQKVFEAPLHDGSHPDGRPVNLGGGSGGTVHAGSLVLDPEALSPPTPRQRKPKAAPAPPPPVAPSKPIPWPMWLGLGFLVVLTLGSLAPLARPQSQFVRLEVAAAERKRERDAAHQRAVQRREARQAQAPSGGTQIELGTAVEAATGSAWTRRMKRLVSEGPVLHRPDEDDVDDEFVDDADEANVPFGLPPAAATRRLRRLLDDD